MQIAVKSRVENAAQKEKMVRVENAILPKNERQIRPLLENLNHNGERIKVWGDVRRVAPVSAAKSLDNRRY